MLRATWRPCLTKQTRPQLVDVLAIIRDGLDAVIVASPAYRLDSLTPSVKGLLDTTRQRLPTLAVPLLRPYAAANGTRLAKLKV